MERVIKAFPPFSLFIYRIYNLTFSDFVKMENLLYEPPILSFISDMLNSYHMDGIKFSIQ